MLKEDQLFLDKDEKNAKHTQRKDNYDGTTTPNTILWSKKSFIPLSHLSFFSPVFISLVSLRLFHLSIPLSLYPLLLSIFSLLLFALLCLSTSTNHSVITALLLFCSLKNLLLFSFFFLIKKKYDKILKTDLSSKMQATILYDKRQQSLI